MATDKKVEGATFRVLIKEIVQCDRTHAAHGGLSEGAEMVVKATYQPFGGHLLNLIQQASNSVFFFFFFLNKCQPCIVLEENNL